MKANNHEFEGALAAGVQAVFLKILQGHGDVLAQSAAMAGANFADFVQAISAAIVAIGATFLAFLFKDPVKTE